MQGRAAHDADANQLADVDPWTAGGMNQTSWRFILPAGLVHVVHDYQTYQTKLVDVVCLTFFDRCPLKSRRLVRLKQFLVAHLPVYQDLLGLVLQSGLKLLMLRRRMWNIVEQRLRRPALHQAELRKEQIRITAIILANCAKTDLTYFLGFVVG